MKLFVGKEIIAKFTALKTKFFKEIKKIEQTSASGAGFDDVYVSDFIHFNKLNFLRVTAAVDKTTSFLDLCDDEFFTKNKENIENEIGSGSSSCSSPIQIIPSTSSAPTPLSSSSSVPASLVAPLSQNKKRALDYTPKPPKRPVKKPKPDDADTLIREAMSTLKDLRKDEANKTDECQVAGSFVSFTLSTLDPEIRVEAIAHIIQYCLSLKKK